ncbi:rab-GTPase-TBC domain-containing protein [Phycomyces nitens]|nr:rab-GTPase-TBC domain-containing protein [Phycomyces nitens]
MPSINPEQQIDQWHQRELGIKRHYDQGTPDLVGEMEKWYSMTDRYGFLKDTPITDRQREKEVERATKWAAMAKHRVLHKEDVHYFPFTKKFIQRVYKGIPDCWRRDAWYFLCTDQLQTATHDDKLRTTYALLLEHESDHDHQIDLDIPRTTGDHIMFKQRYGTGQKSLFNVLRAFSLYDTEVGYCQGMTNIAATILMYFEEEVSVSRAREDLIDWLYKRKHLLSSSISFYGTTSMISTFQAFLS